jgi:hypothetical protein
LNYRLNCNLHSGFFNKYLDYRMRLINDIFSQIVEIFLIENERQQGTYLNSNGVQTRLTKNEVTSSIHKLFNMDVQDYYRFKGTSNFLEQINIKLLKDKDPFYDVILAVYNLMENKSIEVIVGGHSLGGAISAIASVDIKKLFTGICKHFVVHNYTFGSPTIVGDNTFGNLYRSDIPVNFHFVNKNDPVPFISFPTSIFEPHGFMIFMGSSLLKQQRNCECLIGGNFGDHKMYLHYLSSFFKYDYDFSFFNINSNVIPKHTYTNDFDNNLLSTFVNIQKNPTSLISDEENNTLKQEKQTSFLGLGSVKKYFGF